jgi:hypothetical protein
LFFQDMARTPPFALGENTKRGGWEDHQEHPTRRKDIACLHEGQGQSLRVATEIIAEKAIFSVQTLTFAPSC